MRYSELRLGELSAAGNLQTWLPPLVAQDSASSQLIKGLQELDTSRRHQSPTSLQASTIGRAWAISTFGARANERAAEAEAEFGGHDAEDGGFDGAYETTGASGPCSAHGAHGTRDVASARQAFEHLVEGINAALAGGDSLSPLRPLRRDEVLSETLPARGARHYKVALPSRPTAVTITVTRTVGMAPALWGSTGCDRPTGRNHDFRSKDDRLVYEHALPAGEDAEEAAGLDRRNAVPSCRELFVTAEAVAGECSYRLQVTFGQVKIVLSRAEIASHVQKIRRGWESRVSQLQREPALREQFEEHVRGISEEKRTRKWDTHRGVNFLERNMRLVPQASPRIALLQLQKRALQGFAKQDEVSARREDLEVETEQKHLNWLNRGEERRKQRAEEQLLLELERRTEDMRRSWLARLAVVTFSERTGRLFKEMKEASEIFQRQMFAAGVLQKHMLIHLCQKRRSDLFKNVIRLRVGMAAYARTVRPAVMCASQPNVKGFLEAFAFHRELPTLTGALKRFRVRVVTIQSWWQRSRIVRRAFVDLFLPYWNAIQARVYREVAKGLAVQEQSQAQAESNLLKSITGGKHLEAAGGGKNPVRKTVTERGGSRGTTKEGARRQNTGTMSSEEQQQQRSSVRPKGLLAEEDKALALRICAIEQNMEVMPLLIVRKLLSNYIGQMQKSHIKRTQEWEERRKAQQFNKDLAAFGVLEETDMVSDAKPARVYVDKDELEQLVREQIAAWRSGGFKETKHNRRRILQLPFKSWQRAIKCMWLKQPHQVRHSHSLTSLLDEAAKRPSRTASKEPAGANEEA